MIRADLAAAFRSAWDWLRQESARNRRSLRGRLLYTLVLLLIALLAVELGTYRSRVHRRQAAILIEQTRATATLASACRDNLDRLVAIEHLIAYATRPDQVVAGDFETLMRETLAELLAAQAIQVISPSRATVASWPRLAAPSTDAPLFFYPLTP